MDGEKLNLKKDLTNEAITKIVITHEMEFARDVADRIIFMADGSIIEESVPEEFFVKPKTERAKKFLKIL